MSRCAAGALALCCWIACADAQPAAAPAIEPDATPSPLARRPDERRAPFTIDLRGRPLELGFSYELISERRRNFDLDATEARDRDVLDHELELDARWRAGDRLTLFAQAVGVAERRKERSDGSVRKRSAWERGQSWLLIDELRGLPLSLQLGRIALVERRSWWWDEDLDAARLIWSAGEARLETGLARERARLSARAAGIEPDAKGVMRWFGNGSWR